MTQTKNTHKWRIVFDKHAQREFDKLTADQKEPVFAKLRELLVMENPTLHGDVASLIGERGMWRLAVNTKGRHWRVFFTLVSGNLVVQGTEYKGELQVFDVRKKGDNTYR